MLFPPDGDINAIQSSIRKVQVHLPFSEGIAQLSVYIGFHRDPAQMDAALGEVPEILLHLFNSEKGDLPFPYLDDILCGIKKESMPHPFIHTHLAEILVGF